MPTPKQKIHQVGTPTVTSEELPDDDRKVSLLDRFREAITTPVVKPPYELNVPNRDEMTMLFDTPKMDYDLYQAWMRKAEDKKHKETNLMQLAVIVISNLNVGMKLGGQLVERDGEPMTITNSDLHTWLGVPAGSTRAAIRKLYGSDGHAIQAMRMVIEEAGFTLDGDVSEAGDGGPLEG